MKIEVGKSYRTRRGDKVTVYVWSDGKNKTWPFCTRRGDVLSCLTADGHYYPNKCETGSDIVALWEEPALPAEGVKADTGKLPWALLPFDAVRGVVEVLRFGAAKYAPRNWELGMDWSRCFDACLRHLTAWWQGEAKDPETGFSHLWHAGCCILFLIAYEIRGVGKDDRPTPNSD